MGKRIGILTSGGDCPELNIIISQSPSLVAPQSGLVQTARSLEIYVGES